MTGNHNQRLHTMCGRYCQQAMHEPFFNDQAYARQHRARANLDTVSFVNSS